jgi:hypothetical protein
MQTVDRRQGERQTVSRTHRKEVKKKQTDVQQVDSKRLIGSRVDRWQAGSRRQAGRWKASGRQAEGKQVTDIQVV